MRTHRPFADWKPIGRAGAFRWAARGLLLTLAWLAAATPVFAYWQFTEKRLGASFWDPRLWNEAVVAALLCALAFWAVACGVVGIVRWIDTGRGPSA